MLRGSLWDIRHLGRSGNWILWKNDLAKITEGSINDQSGSSAQPWELLNGSKGADALNVAYKGGDSFRLEILQGDFVGVNLCVATQPRIYDLAADFSLHANPTPGGWQYSESIGNGGGPVGPAERATLRTEGLAQYVERAWTLATGRRPTPEEQTESLELVQALMKVSEPLEDAPAALKRLPGNQAAALSKFCLALFNLNEFMYVD